MEYTTAHDDNDKLLRNKNETDKTTMQKVFKRAMIIGIAITIVAVIVLICL